MAIKIECSQCGFRNDLGRVFCTKCGVKLDLKRTSQAELEKRREIEIGPILNKVAVFLFVVVPLCLLGLALWPAKPVALRADQAGAQQVMMKTRAVKQAIVNRQKVSVDFTEPEINGFLAARATLRGVKVLNVDLQQDRFTMMASLAWRPPAATNIPWVVKNKISLPVSFSMTGGFRNGQFVLKSARMGHLPLLGPAQAISTGFFAGLFPDVLAEKPVIDAMAEAVIRQERISFKFGR